MTKTLERHGLLIFSRKDIVLLKNDQRMIQSGFPIIVESYPDRGRNKI